MRKLALILIAFLAGCSGSEPPASPVGPTDLKKMKEMHDFVFSDERKKELKQQLEKDDDEK